jgi:hypothetical protein
VKVAPGCGEDDKHRHGEGHPEQDLHRLSIRFSCDFRECGAATNLL